MFLSSRSETFVGRSRHRGRDGHLISSRVLIRKQRFEQWKGLISCQWLDWNTAELPVVDTGWRGNAQRRLCGVNGSGGTEMWAAWVAMKRRQGCVWRRACWRDEWGRGVERDWLIETSWGGGKGGGGHFLRRGHELCVPDIKHKTKAHSFKNVICHTLHHRNITWDLYHKKFKHNAWN